MNLDFAVIAPVALPNLALLLALTVLLRLVRDAARPPEASEQFMAGLVLGGIALASGYLTGATTGVTLAASGVAVLLAAPLAGPLAAVIAFAIAATQPVLQAGIDGLIGAAPFGPEIGILGILAIIGIVGAQILPQDGPYPKFRPALILSVLGALGYFGVDLGMDQLAGIAPDPAQLPAQAVEAALNVIPGSLIVMAFYRVEKRRRENEDGLAFATVAVEGSADAVLWMATSGKIQYGNAAACKLLGYTKDEFTRRFLRDLDHNAGDPRGPTHLLTDAAAAWPMLFNGRFITKSGSAMVLGVAAALVEFEGQGVVCVNLRPSATAEIEGAIAPEEEPAAVEEGAAAVAAPKPKAHKRRKRDRLTGLPDLVEFRDTATGLAPKAEKREIGNLTIAIVDMDDMNGFNDRRGYQMGDALLATYARVLRQSLRAKDQAFRIDDDAFGVLMPGRGEGAFDYLLGRFDDIMASVRNAGFPDAGATVGFAALSEAGYDTNATFDLALERLQRSKSGYSYSRIVRTRVREG